MADAMLHNILKENKRAKSEDTLAHLLFFISF